LLTLPAAIEATEEAIDNSLFFAETTTGFQDILPAPYEWIVNAFRPASNLSIDR
jgi:hypothetical protein